jgi:hypothetical protein
MPAVARSAPLTVAFDIASSGLVGMIGTIL